MTILVCVKVFKAEGAEPEIVGASNDIATLISLAMQSGQLKLTDKEYIRLEFDGYIEKPHYTAYIVQGKYQEV